MPSAKTLLAAALLVGTLDISAAFIQVAIQSGKSPFLPVLSFITAGLFGKANTLSEPARIVAGLLIHYCIATAFTFFFFLVVAKFSFAKTQRLLTGLLYGLFIWVVMNLLVLPLGGIRPFVFNLPKNLLAAGILIVCIGVPLAFIANRKQPTLQTPAYA